MFKCLNDLLLAHPPFFVFAHGSTGDKFDLITDLIFILTIVNFVVLAHDISFVIFGVDLGAINLDDNGFVHFIRNNDTCKGPVKS